MNFILTSQGELIDFSDCKVSVYNATLVIRHPSGRITPYTYPSAIAAQQDFQNIQAILNAATIGNPYISSVSPQNTAHASLPITFTTTGSNFSSNSPVITLVAYGITSTGLATTYVSATTLTAVVPNTVSIGVYDVLYTDGNGASFLLEGAFVVD